MKSNTHYLSFTHIIYPPTSTTAAKHPVSFACVLGVKGDKAYIHK